MFIVEVSALIFVVGYLDHLFLFGHSLELSGAHEFEQQLIFHGYLPLPLLILSCVFPL